MLSMFGFIRVSVTKKEKNGLLANINKYFILFRFGEKGLSFILGGYI